ncbi:MAG: hypothetical protein ABI670_05400 [Chloroflexota bacterium]
MGFFVDPFDKPTSSRTEPGRDYVPAPDGYEPLINLHNNHSNLEGHYDPRRNINATDNDTHHVSAKSRLLPLLIALIVCIILIISVYLKVIAVQ